MTTSKWCLFVRFIDRLRRNGTSAFPPILWLVKNACLAARSPVFMIQRSCFYHQVRRVFGWVRSSLIDAYTVKRS